MDKMIYLAMNGAREIMLRQATNNNNLANLSTTGFKADLDSFRSLPVYGPGNPSRVYVEDQRAGVDQSSGPVIQTGHNLDVAINGDGFIAIQNHDGSEGYTRAGNFKVNAVGLLETGSGYPVMGNSGPIAIPPFEQIQIGKDGTITIQPLGQSSTTLAIVDRLKLVKPAAGELIKNNNGVLQLKNSETAEPDASVQIVSGALEGSNVNAVAALVNMIDLSRQFEMQIKMMKTAEENDKAAAQILRL